MTRPWGRAAGGTLSAGEEAGSGIEKGFSGGTSGGMLCCLFAVVDDRTMRPLTEEETKTFFAKVR